MRIPVIYSGLILCLLLSGCFAHKARLKQERIAARTPTVAAPSGWKYVWTDSLIATRDSLIQPQNEQWLWSYPEFHDDMYFWHGGVFVVPGTPDSILRSNGIQNVIRKPGTPMHDYYEASWPARMDLNHLPFSIRQVRYGIAEGSPFRLNPPYNPERRVTIGKKSYDPRTLYTIPNLPPSFIEAYGILNPKVLYHFHDFDAVTVIFPVDSIPFIPPPEMLYLLPPPIGDTITETRAFSLPLPRSDAQYLVRAGGKKWVSGEAYVESPQDTALLRQFGFRFLNITFAPIPNRYLVRITWPVELKIDSLPPQIKTIYIPDTHEVETNGSKIH